MEKKKRVALIAWDKVYKPIKKGGLGLRKVNEMNVLLLSKLIWSLFNDSGECKDIWTNRYNLENKDV